MRARRPTAAWTGTLILLVAIAPAARAQDFAIPTPPGSLGDLLERGLPAARGEVVLAALHTRRTLGLTTRALAADVAARGLRIAAGIARTGDPSLGWTSGAAALGLAGEGGAAAIRGVLRRDDDAGAGEPRVGSELGAGVWVAWGGFRAWASSPQLRVVGVAPPLARGLSTGMAYAAGDCAVEIVREAPRRGFAEPAAYDGRVGVTVSGLSVWAAFRDHPWRGGLGVAAEVGPLRCAAQIDSHPLLEPTTRIAIALRGRRS